MVIFANTEIAAITWLTNIAEGQLKYVGIAILYQQGMKVFSSFQLAIPLYYYHAISIVGPMMQKTFVGERKTLKLNFI